MKCYRSGGCGPYEMYPCSECPASKPEYAKTQKKQTNADKYFRNATNEELAEILVGPGRAKFFDKFCDIVLAGENPGFCDDDCEECAINWLKQEVESAEECEKQ